MLLSSHSISSSALSDVYRGRMAGKHVAVKVLRVHADNRVQVAKVRDLAAEESYVRMLIPSRPFITKP